MTMAHVMNLDAVTSCVVSPADVPDSTARKTRLHGYNQVADQALHDALKKHGRKIANSEQYPSNRQVVDANLRFEGFKLRRADNDAKPDAIRKSISYNVRYNHRIQCFKSDSTM